MEEQLISFETAKLAKEKGFDILTHSYYFEDSEFKEHSLKGTNGYYGDEYEFNLSEFNENWNDKWLTKKTGDRCFGCSKQQDYLETFSAPTQSLLQKWLREKHKINVSSDLWDYLGKKQLCTYQYNILKIDPNSDYIKSHKPKMGTTYEEALEIGLQEALKLIK